LVFRQQETRFDVVGNDTSIRVIRIDGRMIGRIDFLTFAKAMRRGRKRIDADAVPPPPSRAAASMTEH
jgi:hypothetical protein